MTVNYCSILTLEIIGFFTAVIYHGKLPQYFNPRNNSFFTTVIYHGNLPWYFYNIDPILPAISRLSYDSFQELNTLAY
jgi:hypothetical protein